MICTQNIRRKNFYIMTYYAIACALLWGGGEKRTGVATNEKDSTICIIV